MSRAYGVVDTGEELVRTASSTMGRNTYERWRQTVPVKDGRVEITNTYKTIRGGEVVREVTTKIAPFSLDEELVVSEIPIGKFAIEELSEKYLVIRRAPDIRR